MSQDNQNQRKLDIKVDENIATGQYSNLAAIRHSREEFIFDFAFVFPDGPMGKLVSRIILSPAHAKRFSEALLENLRRYEEMFGPITPSEGPLGSGFIQ
jgi:hypothetical protein